MANGDIYASIQTGYWSQAEFDANPTWLLGAGQRIDLGQTGRYKLGDGVSELQDLVWLGGGGVDSVNGQTGTVLIDHLPPRVTSITSSATPTPNVDTTDCYKITALATDCTFSITGTPSDFQPLILEAIDNGTSRAVTLSGTNFFDMGGGLTFNTTVSKTSVVTCLYDSLKSKFGVYKVFTEV